MLPTIPSRSFVVRSVGTLAESRCSSNVALILSTTAAPVPRCPSPFRLLRHTTTRRSPASRLAFASSSAASSTLSTFAETSKAEAERSDEEEATDRQAVVIRGAGARNDARPRASNPARFQPQFFARRGGASNPSNFARHNNTAPARSQLPPLGPQSSRDAPYLHNDQQAKSAKGPFIRRPVRPPDNVRSIADWLAYEGSRRPVESTTWVRLDNVSPTSSLEAVIVGMQEALDRHGILNVDAPWDPSLHGVFRASRAGGPIHGVARHASDATNAPLPNFPVYSLEEDFPNDSWIVQARVVLSPFARPTGWYVQLANRSLVHALLSAVEEVPLTCASRIVRVRSAPLEEIGNEIPDFVASDVADAALEEAPTTKGSAQNQNSILVDNSMDQEGHKVHRQLLQVSDATLRIENCCEKTSVLKLLNLFSRYDLRQIPRPTTKASNEMDHIGSPTTHVHNEPPATPFDDVDSTSIVLWTGRTSDGKVPPTTWLVHFRNASWARAALRELQGTTLDGRPLLLAQYPQQIFNGTTATPEIRLG